MQQYSFEAVQRQHDDLPLHMLRVSRSQVFCMPDCIASHDSANTLRQEQGLTLHPDPAQAEGIPPFGLPS
ncbi:hypothetical protein WJX82_010356 [Trebouxia sp. C0006]